MSLGEEGSSPSLERLIPKTCESVVTNEKEVVRLIKMVRPKWKRADLILQRTSSLCSNQGWVAYDINNVEEKLLIQTLPSRDSVKKVIEVQQSLASHNLAPSLEITFANGLVMSHREPLTGQEIGYALASPTLAQSVGALHRILTSSSEDIPALSIFHQVAVWLQQEGVPVEQVEEHCPALPSLENLVSELSTVEEEVALVGHVEVIIGHGNLTPSCLTRGPTGLQFTGLEHCGPAWQPLEIATLFLSLSGLHRLEVMSADRLLPPRSVLIRWLTQYLASYKGVALHQVSDIQLNRLQRQVTLCSLLYLLREVAWAMVTWSKERLDEVARYGEARWEMYRSIKYNILHTEI